MANKRNYQKELDAKIAGLHGEVPTLLLHSCCAPCSSYVLEYLSQYFSITIIPTSIRRRSTSTAWRNSSG